MFQTADRIRTAEQLPFAPGVSAESLMESAGLGIAEAIIARFPTPRKAIAYLGKGNNGGDALVALKHLREAGWSIGIRSAFDADQISELAQKNWRVLEPVTRHESIEASPAPSPLILLDGLLGIGTSGPIRMPLSALAREMNALRASGQAKIIAMDMPSGMDNDTGETTSHSVIADLTCTVAIPKIGLTSDKSISHVGSIAFIPLPRLTPGLSRNEDHLITPHSLPVSQLVRQYDLHKGQAGRVGIIAGSRGLAGAAALTSLGALRAGAGLITLFVMEEDYPLILPLVPLEVMVKPITDYRDILDKHLDCLAIGPGLGTPSEEQTAQLLDLITQLKTPTVLDADALNLIARESSLTELRSSHLLTPHPGEMLRLNPEILPTDSRTDIVKHFTQRTSATLLFKGARTIISAAGHPLAYNTTGTPGMATGGQGDVLTGIIAALIGQGLSLYNATRTGAWLAGRASELAISHGNHSAHSLSATVTAEHLGMAYRELTS